MSWPASLAVALLTGVLGLVAAGYVMSLCVRWYRISSFEGGSGYAVIGVALVGGVAGTVLGLVVARMVAGEGFSGFLKAFGVAGGLALALAAVAAWIARSLADVPPTIDGRELELDVEIRLPVDVKSSPAAGSGESWTELHSVSGGTVRKSVRGDLRPAEARLEDGRWIVPGSVRLFTTRGKRSLGIHLHGEALTGYLLPLPAEPGPEHEEWSPWGPRPPAPNPPWPDTKPSYRFRVRKVPDAPAPPSPEAVAAEEAAEERARFDATAPDASLATWMAWTSEGVAADLRAQALARIAARPALVDEMSALMRSDDTQSAADAMRLVERLPSPPRELVAPVAEAGRDIAARIRRFNATRPEDDPSCEGAADAAVRFGAWMVAVRTLREKCGGDFTPELGEILVLSRVRSDSHVMRSDVLRVASWHMHEWTGLEPLPADPKPR
jgi:hypothetical protein